MGAGEEPDTWCSWPAPIKQARVVAALSCPRLGGRERVVEWIAALVPYLPSPSLFRPQPLAITLGLHPLPYIWAPFTPNFPKTHPQIKHAHRTFFPFRARRPLLHRNPAILLPRSPSPPNLGENASPQCLTTLNRPLCFLPVSTPTLDLIWLSWESGNKMLTNGRRVVSPPHSSFHSTSVWSRCSSRLPISPRLSSIIIHHGYPLSASRNTVKETRAGDLPRTYDAICGMSSCLFRPFFYTFLPLPLLFSLCRPRIPYPPALFCSGKSAWLT